ncbi:hypothetical protein XELAEV_18025390mg [Xenopus laevis]|uniref:Uncharacterized protein n=1 Tax=Xenopus laevis TaxID=8355 RepID=A0A974D1K8_XENLA|nr:hypothetical protein XELAEV_18025390mg [Xenopus laevis]
MQLLVQWRLEMGLTSEGVNNWGEGSMRWQSWWVLDTQVEHWIHTLTTCHPSSSPPPSSSIPPPSNSGS